MSSEVTFASLGLAEPLLRAIADTGYTEPTPIQAKAIPLVLDGGDLLAAAQTGTGKTAGFTLPLLQRLSADPGVKPAPGRPRCLILTPTRELAAQVEEAVQIYGKYVAVKSMVMFGGVGIHPQIAALKSPIDILVATPGRLLDHIGQKTLNLSDIEILVLDEADRMLDMGFIHDIKKVLALLPKDRQNLLFSATFSDEIRALANGLLRDPRTVDVAPRNTASELVDQKAYMVGQKHKRELLAHLVKKYDWHQVLVFTRTKHGANRLAEYLCKRGINSLAIHGNKSQNARTRALAEFKDGTLPVLVATDIAARGLDIEELPHVVNFELPNVSEDYVHRIGRTGRAGSTGSAIALVDAEEMKLLTGIERLIRRSIERATEDDFVPSAQPDQGGGDSPDGERPPRREGQRPNRGEQRGEPREPRPPREPRAPREPRPAGQAQPTAGPRPPREPREPRQPRGDMQARGPKPQRGQKQPGQRRHADDDSQPMLPVEPARPRTILTAHEIAERDRRQRKKQRFIVDENGDVNGNILLPEAPAEPDIDDDIGNRLHSPAGARPGAGQPRRDGGKPRNPGQGQARARGPRPEGGNGGNRPAGAAPAGAPEGGGKRKRNRNRSRGKGEGSGNPAAGGNAGSPVAHESSGGGEPAAPRAEPRVTHKRPQRPALFSAKPGVSQDGGGE